MTLPRRPKFTLEVAQRAHDAWGANCGPAALAAVLGLTLDDVRPHLKGFDAKRYTNPTMMLDALKSLGVVFSQRRPPLVFPRFGLARIQWEGPWTSPGVPMKARYRQTHWVGAFCVDPKDPASVGIFDINAMQVGGWVVVEDWRDKLVPWIIRECVPRASGGWHITHSIEIEVAK